MNVKFLNNTSKWQMEFNSAFKGLKAFSSIAAILPSYPFSEPELGALSSAAL
jgi:hypothetical protein